MKDCRLISLWMIPALLLMFSGCSRTPCYKGYVPATEEDALAFARELMDRHEHGDDSWFYSPSLADMCDPEYAKAAEAGLYFCGLDIPKVPPHFYDRTNEEKQASAARTMEALSKTSDIVFKDVEPKDKTYCVCFECLYEGERNEQRLKFVKHKKSGRFVVLGTSMRPSKPKGERQDQSN